MVMRLTNEGLRHLIRSEVMKLRKAGHRPRSTDPYAWLDQEVVDWRKIENLMDESEGEFAEYVSRAPYKPDHDAWSTDDQMVYDAGHRRVYVAWSGDVELPEVQVDDGSGWRKVRIKNYS